MKNAALIANVTEWLVVAWSAEARLSKSAITFNSSGIAFSFASINDMVIRVANSKAIGSAIAALCPTVRYAIALNSVAVNSSTITYCELILFEQ